MNGNYKKQIPGIALILILGAVIGQWLLSADHHDNGNPAHDEHSGAHDDQGEEMEKGPNGGRLLTQGDFAVEITLFESGIPPEFRIFSYNNGKLLSPGDVTLSMQLDRLGNKRDNIKFTAQDDFLRGDTVVYEPHSFVVSMNASYQGNTYTWKYDNFEGRTRIPKSMAKEMGILTEPVGAVKLAQTLTLTGRVHNNPNRLSRVRARFPGVVNKIFREQGEWVKKGDTLARVQSNESLQNYIVKAPISGHILTRDLQIGEATGSEPLFIIADLKQVWIELDVFASDLKVIKTGQKVLIETLDGDVTKSGKVDWISPLAAHASQSVRARVVMENKDNRLKPGQFIRAHVTVATHPVALAVKKAAIQNFRDFKVVYALFDDEYEVRMLELGRSNKEWVEVLEGIDPGTQYVTNNSYLIKADIEKSGASHDH